jgi:hypothetical protein
MKTKRSALLLLFAAALGLPAASPAASASDHSGPNYAGNPSRRLVPGRGGGGDKGGNSGVWDIGRKTDQVKWDRCEDRLPQLRDLLINWIEMGGSADMDIRGALSRDEYDRRMLQQLRDPEVTLSCATDSAMVIAHGGGCWINRSEPAKAGITCDPEIFAKQEIPLYTAQYRAMHEAFARLAGIEVVQFDDSGSTWADIAESYGGWNRNMVLQEQGASRR